MPNTSAQNHKVSKGESLWKIAEKQFGDPTLWRQIAAANGMQSPYWIFVGQTIKLPAITKVHRSPALHRTTATAAGHVGAHDRQLITTPTLAAPTSVMPFNATANPIGPSSSPGAAIGVKLMMGPPEAVQLARDICHPAFKYELGLTEPVILAVPNGTIAISLLGSLTLQKQGVLCDIEISNLGVTARLKRQADDELTRLTSKSEVRFPWEPGQPMQLKCELAVAAKIHGQVFATQKVDIIGMVPLAMRCTLEAVPVRGSSNGYNFNGTFGFRIVWTQNSSPPQGVPAAVPVPQSAPGKWVAIGLLLGAVGLVAVSIASNVATLGTDTPADAVSFSAAAKIFGWGLQAF